MTSGLTRGKSLRDCRLASKVYFVMRRHYRSTPAWSMSGRDDAGGAIEGGGSAVVVDRRLDDDLWHVGVRWQLHDKSNRGGDVFGLQDRLAPAGVRTAHPAAADVQERRVHLAGVDDGRSDSPPPLLAPET